MFLNFSIIFLFIISMLKMQAEIVNINVFTDHMLVKPGGITWVAVEISPNDGWHTYWVNPGDAGLATTVEFNLPNGFEIIDTIWQIPEIILSDSIVSYGYHKKHYIFFLLHTPEIYNNSYVDIALKVKWLACKEKCIPGSSDLNFKLNFSSVGIRNLEFEDIFKDIPLKLPDLFTAFVENNALNIIIPENYKFSTNSRFIPYIEGLIDHLAEQKITEQTIIAPLDRFHIELPEFFKAILIDNKKAYEINVKTIF